MHLSEIWIYPVKSLGGIRLPESEVMEKGLKYDRRWMIVDENGLFLTQRNCTKMALLDVSFSVGNQPKGLVLSSRMRPDEQLHLPFQRISDEAIQVRIWKDTVTARTVSDDSDRWLSGQLGKKVRIVEMPESTERKMNPADVDHNHLVSFADDFPYLLISEASLEDLNTKLGINAEMKRFRPNFVVSGTAPYAEDSWKNIRIGDATFAVLKPCERCILINIDPSTGNKGPEPLKTLASYRKAGNKIMFGQNLIHLTTGTVREDDVVTLL